MARSKLKKVDKINFVRWVHTFLIQSLTKQNIKVRFRVKGIWPFNLKAMDEKTKPTNNYTTISNHVEGDDHYTSKEQASQSTRRGIIYSCKTI